jgi:hypothetical protein
VKSRTICGLVIFAQEQHNGQRLEYFSPEVKIIAKLTAKDCELKY